MAYGMCSNQESSLIYAHLCNSASVIYYDQNDLGRCQTFLEKSVKIRESLLLPGDQELATSYGNLASLMASLKHYDEAFHYLKLSEQSRRNNGEEHRIADAVFQSTYGWVYRVYGDFERARQKYDMAKEMYSGRPAIELLTT